MSTISNILEVALSNQDVEKQYILMNSLLSSETTAHWAAHTEPDRWSVALWSSDKLGWLLKGQRQRIAGSEQCCDCLLNKVLGRGSVLLNELSNECLQG